MTKPSVLLAITLLWTLAVPSISMNLTAHEACKLATNRSSSKSVLLPHEPSNLVAYDRHLLSQSLRRSARLSDHIRRAIMIRKELPAASSGHSSLGALDDCLLLSQLNTRYLNSTLTTLNTIANPADLTMDEADKVHALLSGVVANQETCSDGLMKAASTEDQLFSLVAGGSALYQATLATFAGSRNRKRGRHLLEDLRVRRDGMPQWLITKKLFSRFGWRTRPGKKLLSDDGRLPMDDGHVVVVAQDSSGDFQSINDAIAAAPEDVHPSDGYHVIRIKAGIYQEYVKIGPSNTNILMVGDGIEKTIVTGNRSVADGFTTTGTATFAVMGDNFLAVGITIRNTAGPGKHQAVALMNGADNSVFYRCSFDGYQDTLYARHLRQFYRECDIYGTIDFIFGDAAAVFQLCNIYVRLPLHGNANMVTAQGRATADGNTGIAIIHSNISATPELEAMAADGQVQSFLGRPWREYSRTVIMFSNIGGFIDPAGWSQWSGDFGLSTLYYGEYQNSGAGADTRKRVTWPGFHLMTEAEANNFTVGTFLDGDSWLPATNVPFSLGLL